MPKLKQGDPARQTEVLEDGEIYICLISFSSGVGSWSRDTDAGKAIKRCAGIAKEDFHIRKRDYPINAILWRVPDTDLYWEAEQVPKWDGHDDHTATWWRMIIEHDHSYTVDEDYKPGG